MRLSLSLVFAIFAATSVACDNTYEQPAVGPEVAVEPMDLSACRAASDDGMAALESMRAGANVCEVDSDCTIAVAETRCTGEVPVAVSVDDEARFLLLADKLDARLCADLPATCGAAREGEVTALGAACVEGRCVIE